MTPMQIDMSIVPIVTSMMNTGFKLDIGYLRNLEKEFLRRLDVIQTWIDTECGHHLNPNSSDQVMKWCETHRIKDYTGMKLRKADSETLAPIRNQHKVIDLVLQSKELSKLLGTYVSKFPGMVDSNDRLHTSFSITTADTFRLASYNPNLQNIPSRTDDGRRIRGAFIASPGYILLGTDYSQQELRWQACLSMDEVMLDIYRKDGDIHSMTEDRNFGTIGPNRKKAKEYNFSTGYGISPHSLWLRMLKAGIFDMSKEDCARGIDNFWSTYAGLKRYRDFIEMKIRRDGYIDSYYGYRTLIPEVRSCHSDVQEGGVREGVNFTIQNPSAAQMKIAMAKLDSEMLPFGDEWRPLLQVHDEIITEVKESLISEATEIQVACLETAEVDQALMFKAEPKIGYRWNEMEEV